MYFTGKMIAAATAVFLGITAAMHTAAPVSAADAGTPQVTVDPESAQLGFSVSRSGSSITVSFDADKDTAIGGMSVKTVENEKAKLDRDSVTKGQFTVMNNDALDNSIWNFTADGVSGSNIASFTLHADR